MYLHCQTPIVLCKLGQKASCRHASVSEIIYVVPKNISAK